MMKTTITLLVCSTLVVLTCANFVDVPRWTEIVKTRNEQCIDQGFTGACDFERVDGSIEYSCVQLKCAKGINGNYKPYFGWAVAEGSYCGDSQACIRQKCVHLEAHQLPEYTDKETKLPGCN